MLKLVAILLMLIDHLAITLIPDTTVLYWACRIIGRFAMPIFCYQLALGFIHTRSLSKYLGRVSLMTLTSQIPFALMCIGLSFPSLWLSYWNVGLTFMCSLGVLWCLKCVKTHPTHAFLSLTCLVLLLMLSTFGDYGIYGVLMTVIFYFTLTYKLPLTYTCVLLAALTLIVYGLFGTSASLCLLQLCCLGSLVFIHLLKNQRLSWLPSWFFYVFYPLHMFILSVIRDFFLA
ncbi:MAG: TraX family protein [Cellulosilyticaceae bacterium]